MRHRRAWTMPVEEARTFLQRPLSKPRLSAGSVWDLKGGAALVCPS
jgi:hypothetical protein